MKTLVLLQITSNHNQAYFLNMSGQISLTSDASLLDCTHIVSPPIDFNVSACVVVIRVRVKCIALIDVHHHLDHYEGEGFFLANLISPYYYCIIV